MSNHILQLYACLFHLQEKVWAYFEVINSKMPLYLIKFRKQTEINATILHKSN